MRSCSLLVIARGGNEREIRRIGAPLHVGPFAAAAGDVVAQRGAVLIGRHLQAHHMRIGDVDHHALNGGDHVVAGQRIFPGLQRGMADGRR